MCVTYGVEHKTAVSVESDLPFVLMGVVLIVGILGRRIYVKVELNVKEPGPGIKFKKRGEMGVEKMRAKYMRVRGQNRRAQDSVSEGHPNRARASHRVARFRVISPTL
jgi:hypothetical protein